MFVEVDDQVEVVFIGEDCVSVGDDCAVVCGTVVVYVDERDVGEFEVGY